MCIRDRLKRVYEKIILFKPLLKGRSPTDCFTAPMERIIDVCSGSGRLKQEVMNEIKGGRKYIVTKKHSSERNKITSPSAPRLSRRY